LVFDTGVKIESEEWRQIPKGETFEAYIDAFLKVFWDEAAQDEAESHFLSMPPPKTAEELQEFAGNWVDHLESIRNMGTERAIIMVFRKIPEYLKIHVTAENMTTKEQLMAKIATMRKYAPPKQAQTSTYYQSQPSASRQNQPNTYQQASNQSNRNSYRRNSNQFNNSYRRWDSGGENKASTNATGKPETGKIQPLSIEVAANGEKTYYWPNSNYHGPNFNPNFSSNYGSNYNSSNSNSNQPVNNQPSTSNYKINWKTKEPAATGNSNANISINQAIPLGMGPSENVEQPKN